MKKTRKNRSRFVLLGFLAAVPERVRGGFTKTFPARLRPLALALLGLAFAPGAPAASDYWSASTSGIQTDGSGTWTSANQWVTSQGGSSHITWSSGDTAIIGNGGTAGTITSVVTTVNGITFNSGVSGNYTIAGSSPLTLGLAVTPMAVNNSSTISCPLGGAGMGITKTGAGTLTLSGANTYTGATTVNAGTLSLYGSRASLNAASAVTVAGGAQLWFQSTADGQTFNYNSFPLNLTGQGADNNGAHQTAIFAYNNNGIYNVPGNITVTNGVQFYTYGINNTPNLGGVFSGTGDMSFVADGLGSHQFVFSGNSAASGYAGSYIFYAAGSSVIGKLSGGANRLPITATVSLQANGNTASFDLNGQNQQIAALVNGGVNANDLVQNTGAGTPALTISNALADTFTGVLGGGGASFALTKSGSGTLTLSGANTYTGATTVNAGTLAITAANSCSGPSLVGGGATLNMMTIATGAGACTVSNSATLGVTLATSGSSLTNASLTLGTTGADATTLNLNFSTFANPAQQIITVTGSLSLNGTCTLNVVNGALVVGQFPLLKYGSKSGSGNFVLGALPLGMTASLSNNLANSSVDLVITGLPVLIYWNGNVSAVWDTNTTANWKIGATAGLTYSDTTNLVRFDDTAAGNFAVTLNSTVKPASVTVSNSTHNYSITGNGGIGGGTALTKYGSGTLTLGTINTYIGATTVNAGVVQYNNASAVGSTGQIIANGGSVNFAFPGATITTPIIINGIGTGSGAINCFPSDGNQITFSNTITLLGSSTILGYGIGSILNFAGIIGGTGDLTFSAGAGANTHNVYFALKNSSALNYLGNTIITSPGAANATVQLQGGALPSGTALTLQDANGGYDAVFDLNGNNQTLAGLTDVAASGGSGRYVVNTSGTQSILTINNSTNYTFAGVIGVNNMASARGQTAGTGNIALVITGPGVSQLNGTNTYTGGTTVNGGTLGGTGVFPGPIVVTNGGTLQAGGSGSGTLTCGGLTGSATATFSLALGATNNLANGMFRVNGNLTLAGTIYLTDLGGLGRGVYTNFYYAGALVNNGVTVTSGRFGTTAMLDTSVTNYVLLRVLNTLIYPAAAASVPMSSASPLALTWADTSGAVSYDVYLGTVSNAVAVATTNTAGIYLGRTNAITLNVTNLQPNTTYFWRVDGVAANGVITPGVVYAFTTGAAMLNLQQDSWVVTDALGRTLPTYAQAGAPRTNRTVGVFYYLWQGAHGSQVDDITKALANYPSDPLSTNNTAFHAGFYFWGEPEDGYFRAEDPWYIRRQLQMLSDAKVDFIYFDVSNGYIYLSTVLQLCQVSMQMRNQGIPTPQIMFMTAAGNGARVNELYDQFYSQSLYKDLWFYWQGKPVIMCEINDPSSVMRPEVKSFFTLKNVGAWSSSTTSPDYWQWLDNYPQDYAWSVNPATPEQIPVCVASHPTITEGKSYHNGAQPAVDTNYLTAYTGQGLHAAEQWTRALQVDPQIVMVTQWNEWTVAQYPWTDGNATYAGRPIKNGDSFFVDDFNQEFNRDMAPMKGGYTDNYYYQMIANIRKYKGMDAPPGLSAPTTINVAGSFSVWANITPVFNDPVGDTLHRNFASYDPTVIYTNNSGRNDFIESRTTYDNTNIYLYVKTAQAITSYTDTNWMVLFVDADQNKGTGWEGYDYAVNLGTRTATTTTLSQNSGTNWNWTTVRSDLAYQVTGNELMLTIPRSSLGLTNAPVAFDFHWADNFQTNDITGFFLYGDSAPDRRFNYRYQLAAAMVGNGSFETPPFTNAGYQTSPSGATWTFGGSAGIAHNGSPWFMTNAPDGTQGGFMQYSGSSISQSVNFAAGSYTINFSVVGRSGYGSLPLNVLIDGSNVLALATAQIGTTSWSNYTSSAFTVSAGPHTVAFVNGTLAGDHANVIDNVQCVIRSVYYWDNNGTTAGFGTAGGTWVGPTVSQWNSDPAGVATPLASYTTATDDAVSFGNGATGLGAGTITVSGSVSNGNMTFASGSGAIILTNGTITLAAASTIIVDNAADTISSVLAGTSGLTKAGPGTLALTGANTYTGGTTISNGTVTFNTDSALGVASSANNITLNGGKLVSSASGQTISALRSMTIGAGGGTLANPFGGILTYGGIIGGPGLLTLDVTQGGGTGMTISGQNTNTGGAIFTGNPASYVYMVVSSVGVPGSLVSGPFGIGTVTFNGPGTRSTTGGDTTNGNAIIFAADTTFPNVASEKTLTLTGPVNLTGNRTLTVNVGATVAGKSVSITNVISDGGNNYSLTKAGTGRLVLSGPNTYGGNTTVSGGTLLVNNPTGSGTGTGAVTVNGGTLGGTGIISGVVTNNANGTLSPGVAIGTLNIAGNLVLKFGSTNTFEVNGSTPTNDVIVLGGGVTYGGVLNIVKSGTFTAGQSFRLFKGTGTTNASNFASLVGSPGTGKSFSFTNGVLSVVMNSGSNAILSNLPILTNSVSGGVLSLAWPADEGWRLQYQTNALTVGLGTNWVEAADSSVSSTNITIDSANPTVFYRLIYP